MRRTWRSFICIALCLMMCFSLAGMNAFAKAITSTASAAVEKTIFKCDFEDVAVDASIPTSATDLSKFSTKHANTVGTITAYQDDTVCARFFHTGTEEKSTGPRLIKTINIPAFKSFTLKYKFKSDAVFACSLYSSEGGDQQFYHSTAVKWTEVEIAVNVSKKNYSVKVDGKEVNSKQPFTITSDMNQAQIRFNAALQKAGQFAMIDDVEISTTDDITPEAAFSKEGEAAAVVEATPVSSADMFTTDAPKALAIPSGMSTIIDDTFEKYPNDAFGTSLQWDDATGNKSYINIAPLGTNKALKFSNNTSSSHGPRIGKVIGANVSKLTIEFAIMGNSGAKTTVSIGDSTVNPSLYLIKGESKKQSWSYYKFDVDFKAFKADVYQDGNAIKQGVDISALKDKDISSLSVKITVAAATGAEAYLDNVIVYTPDKVVSMFDLEGKLNPEAVVCDNPTGLSEKIRKTHPRVIITDWDEIRNKINTDPNCKNWFNTLLSAADAFVFADQVTEYKINVRGNANDISHNFIKNAETLGFVAGVTNDRKYTDALLKELRNSANNWPDWGEKTFMVGSHIIRGFVSAYDWAYNTFTEEEKKELEGYLIDHAATIVMKAYDGKLSNGHTVLQAYHNQAMTTQCTCVMLAVAINDIAPNISEYIFRKIATNLPTTFQELSNDGGFAEPAEYWAYGAGWLMNAVATLENCVEDRSMLPADLDFANKVDFDCTPDFMIYYSGATKAFNYNASTAGQLVSPELFWVASRYNKPQYAWFELNVNKGLGSAKTYGAGTDATMALAFYDPNNISVTPDAFPLDKAFSNDRLYGPNGFSARSSWSRPTMLFAAMQGGDNRAFHAYKALGTFVLDWAGERYALQTGKDSVSGTYTVGSKYSGSGDDLYWERTEGNNTLTINPDAGSNQKADAIGYLEKTDSSSDASYGILDLTRTRDDLNSWKRGLMMHDNRSRVIIQDEVSAKVPSEIYWFMHTNADVVISEDGKGATMDIKGKKIYARINAGPSDAVFTLMDIEPLPTSPNPDVQKGEFLPTATGDKKLTVHMQGVTDTMLSIEFIPIKEGEGIPSDTYTAVPMSSWSVDKAKETSVGQRLGNVVALKLNTPSAYALSERTYVDKANKDVYPFVLEGRTLVPVRFISESFGASVSWDDKTRTVGVKLLDKNITMQLGNNIMKVNGNDVVLDVCADVYNDRTLIPLRALCEALGKNVFWDDRGLIIISDEPVSFDEKTISDACKMLDIRLLAGDKEPLFSPERKDYYIEASPCELSVFTNGKPYEVSSSTSGDIASAWVDGEEYRIHFVSDPFANAASGPSISKIAISYEGAPAMPDHDTFIKVADVDSSTGWGKYQKWGSVDGIISEAMDNRWTGEGSQWISYDLGSVQNVHSFAIQGTNSSTRTFSFSVEVSNDGTNWTLVKEKAETIMHLGPTVINLGDVSTRFVKLNTIAVSGGGAYHSYAELRFYSDAAMEAEDQNAWNTIFNIPAYEGNPGSSLKLLVNGFNRDDEPTDVSGCSFKYESSDESKVSVDQNGVCTLKAQGSAEITVTASAPGMLKKTATITINVL